MVKRLERVSVECYAGSRANEVPRAFTHGGKRIIVAEVVDRWYEAGLSPRSPRLDCYKVRSDDGAEYLLRYNGLFDAWALLIDERWQASGG